MQRARPPTDTILPPLKPIPIKERMSVIFVEKGEIDVVDGAFVVVDCLGERVRPVLTHIPVGGVACIMLEPGTRVSHRAAALAAQVGTLLVWVGSISWVFPTPVGRSYCSRRFSSIARRGQDECDCAS